jgi:hypothetical protein
VKARTIKTLMEGKHVEIEVTGTEKVSWLESEMIPYR